MLWLKIRQLKSGTLASRRKTALDLWRDPDPRAMRALSFVVSRDPDIEVRQTAAAALGRLQDPARYEPLIKALLDKEPEVVRAALTGLRRATEEQVIQAVVSLLRHSNYAVRLAAAQTIDTLRWTPGNTEQRVWFQTAKGWCQRAAASGPEAIPALQLTLETSPVTAAIKALDGLRLIADPKVFTLLRGALHSNEPAISIAAAEALGKTGGTEAVAALIASLASGHAQVRAASVQALGELRAAEATGMICTMLQDKEWEVRREAAATLGTLKSADAVEPLTKALEDTDADVRETAAMALGKIANRRAIGPLVLALKDEISSVRRMAAAGLSRINPDWASLPETRAAAEKLKEAIKNADPAVKFFVSQLLVNLGQLAPGAMGVLKPDEHLASPAGKRKRLATDLFVAMLEDADRDIRQAAVEALGRLGGDRARQALARTGSDPDGDVAAATQMALQALGPEQTT
jgi:HEAT repeat protein